MWKFCIPSLITLHAHIQSCPVYILISITYDKIFESLIDFLCIPRTGLPPFIEGEGHAHISPHPTLLLHALQGGLVEICLGMVWASPQCMHVKKQTELSSSWIGDYTLGLSKFPWGSSFSQISWSIPLQLVLRPFSCFHVSRVCPPLYTSAMVRGSEPVAVADDKISGMLHNSCSSLQHLSGYLGQ